MNLTSRSGHKAEIPRAAIGRVLIIAGSDSGGGAGLQGDIKAVLARGGYAMTAVTAITVQDTTGVHGVWPVPLDTVEGQMRVTLSDIGADVIKTGMLGTAALVERVARVLDEAARGVPRVIDPVMVATSGDRLADNKAVEAIRSELIPGAALVTPNAPEAEVLTGRAVEGVEAQRRAADRLLEAGARAVLVKGGHVGGAEIVDVLHTQAGEWQFRRPRLDSRATHGTGCTLASAIATGLARGQPLPEAVEEAIDWLRGAIAHAPGFGRGHGPLNPGWAIPGPAAAHPPQE
jgi:hydroxymethylpyrimidine/phosphomethylpyrimidine kinase